MDLQLTGKVTLITGPAKGMGAAITTGFAHEGCNLILAGRDVAAIEPVTDEVRAMGRRVTVLSCDLTDTPGCQAMVDAAIVEFGAIDILVPWLAAPDRWAKRDGKPPERSSMRLSP